MTSNAGLVLKNPPAALRAGWQQRSFPPGPAGNFANVGQQIVHLVAFKPRPRRAQLLHPHLHLRSMIPHGLRPHDGGVDALHSREVRCETAGRSLLAVAAHATFGREQALATALITGLVHISRRVQERKQIGHVLVIQVGVGDFLGAHAFPHSRRVVPHGAHDLSNARLR
jgi:hypothetical protein